MKKSAVIIAMMLVPVLASAQLTDAQKAAMEAAKTVNEAPEVEQKVEKPKYWDMSLKTQVNIGQTSLTNWAAGGDNTVSLAAFIDGNANYKKAAMIWTNRLQLDYGFLYASSKPLLQKSNDRIYLESKWGYQAGKVENLHFSASYNFLSQFANGYEYKTPNVENLEDMSHKDQVAAWKSARILKSSFVSPAYTNLALGLDYAPWKWLNINFAPFTGGFVICSVDELRNSYGMALKKSQKALASEYSGKTLEDFEEGSEDYNKLKAHQEAIANGSAYRNARFEFGAQLKVDVKVNINDNFSYGTQLVLFSNYLDKPQNLRVNWDNRIDWKLAKYFSFTITTNLIYDDKVLIKSEKDIEKYPNGRQRVQFKESLAFGFTYTIAGKK